MLSVSVLQIIMCVCVCFYMVLLRHKHLSNGFYVNPKKGETTAEASYEISETEQHVSRLIATQVTIHLSTQHIFKNVHENRGQ